MRARRPANSDITTFESTQLDSLTTFDGPDFGSVKAPAQFDGDLTTFTTQYHHTDVTESVGSDRADQRELTTFDSEDSVPYKPAFGRQTGGMSSLTTFESDSMSYNPQLSFGKRARGMDSLTTFDSDSTVSRKSKSGFGKRGRVMESLTTFDSDTHSETALTTFDVAPNQIDNNTLTTWATDSNNLHL